MEETLLPKDLSREVITRLKTIEGQVSGLRKMLEEGKNPNSIVNQFKAVDSALESAYGLLVDEVFRKSLAVKIVEATNDCTGNCGKELELENLRKQFPNIAQSELPEKIDEAAKISKHIKDSEKKAK